MAINDDKKLALSRRVATVWVVISMAVAVIIGIIGYSLELNGAISVLADKERIIITIAEVISRYGFIFAFGAGLITFLIRFYGSYPEGVSFAILLMNILSPYIEKWTAKMPLGGKR
jgi:hypothetical protein